MFTHNLDPVIFNIGIVSIRWYSLAYILGIVIGWWYGKKLILNKTWILEEKFNLKHFDDLITYLVVSIIIGGRLGYVVFYNIEYYLSNPVDIFKIWEGGMSFHGALIGIILGTYIFAIRRKIKTLFLLDVLACVSPIGIFFGRIANFINSELVGKVSSVPWSVIFPKIDLMPRHPSQLYEAVLEGLILFLILNVIFSRKYEIGSCSSLFLIFYGIFRMISEMFREPDVQLGYIFNLASMGSILSFVMILSGITMFYIVKKR
jgi:phosphatidylglycerol:prolipoprotein diacylglycerol transferase